MRILIQNPLWLVGLLIAVPLIAHLFAKAAPRRREFPSVFLLKEAMRMVNKVRKPRDWWLLALRTLAIASVIFAFLQPWLFKETSVSERGVRTAILIVDASASMGFADSTRTRMALAASAAEEVLGTLPAGSRANVIWICANPYGALPEPGVNLGWLRDELRKAGARPEPANVAAAFEEARRQLNDAEGAREVIVISDFQKTSWQNVRWEFPAGVGLSRIAIGEGPEANIAVSGLNVEPASPVAGTQAVLSCLVQNYSDEPRRTTVYIEAGELRKTQAVELPPWGERLALVPVSFPSEGIVPIKASISEDRFPGDDLRFRLVPVRSALSVAIAAPATDSTANIWERACRAMGAQVHRKTLEEMETAPAADITFISGWNGADIQLIQNRQGSGLVIYPAPGSNKILPSAKNLGATLAIQKRDPGWRVRVAAEDHPIFSLYADGSYGDPAQMAFGSRLDMPKDPTGLRVLLAYEDGVPALAAGERDGLGAVVLWNMDLSSTAWPSDAMFVPFFGELLRYLSSGASAGDSFESEPGASLLHTLDARVNDELALVDHKEVSVEIRASADGRTYESASAIAPGLYRWTAGGGVLGWRSVNFPEKESDLRRFEPGAINTMAAGTLMEAGRVGSVASSREGIPLAPWVLAAAAIFLLVEGFILLLSPGKPLRGGVPAVEGKS